MYSRKALLLTFVTLILFSLLSGCASDSDALSDTDTSSANPPPKVQSNDAPGAFRQQDWALLDRLRSSGVQVIQVGDEVKLIFSTDQFFVPNTPILVTENYPALDTIIALVNKHENFGLKVAGYTDNQGWSKRDLALSRQQALAIADYFWRHGIDTRVVYVAGYGLNNPVASDITNAGRASNRRIEITLRLLHDEDSD